MLTRITSWQQRSTRVPSMTAAYRYNLRDELLEATDTNTSQVLLDRETWGLDHGGNCPALRS